MNAYLRLLTRGDQLLGEAKNEGTPGKYLDPEVFHIDLDQWYLDIFLAVELDQIDIYQCRSLASIARQIEEIDPTRWYA